MTNIDKWHVSTSFIIHRKLTHGYCNSFLQHNTTRSRMLRLSTNQRCNETVSWISMNLMPPSVKHFSITMATTNSIAPISNYQKQENMQIQLDFGHYILCVYTVYTYILEPKWGPLSWLKKSLVLEGWPSKIEVSWVLGKYGNSFEVYQWEWLWFINL